MLALEAIASGVSFYRTFLDLAWSVPLGVLDALARGPKHRAGALLPARDAFHAARLRRAASAVRVFAAAPAGGEKEAAYRALIRLAACLGPAPGGAPLTPGALYRDLTRGTQRAPVSGPRVLAFDARVCAELDRRDVARP